MQERAWQAELGANQFWLAVGSGRFGVTHSA